MAKKDLKIPPASKCFELLSSWFDDNGRTLPWRKQIPDPYEAWVSEIMLQQTRAAAVIGYYQRFLGLFPDVFALAKAPMDDVLKAWEGLGYYSRARNLKKCAETIVFEHDGVFPSEKEALLRLPGIGEYTASAIAAIAFGKKEVAVDGNLIRVFARLSASSLTKESQEMKQACYDFFAPWVRGNPSLANQALMDFGELVCSPNGVPHCGECPFASFCKANQEGNQECYPLRKPKKPKKEEKRTVLLFVCGNKVALRKRPDQGLLASLYEFPNVESWFDLARLREEVLPAATAPISIEKTVNASHVFSHLIWKMEGYVVEVKEQKDIPNVLWASKADLDGLYSVPSAFKAYRKAIEPFL